MKIPNVVIRFQRQLKRALQSMLFGYGKQSTWDKFETANFSADLRAAKGGDALAQYYMGLTYGLGLELPKDFAEAAKWFLLAAEQGHAEARIKLSNAYNVGHGVQKNVETAIEWLRIGADDGDPDAQHLLGQRYAAGEGVRKDIEKALELYQLSAKKGHSSAQMNLGMIYFDGVEVPKDIVQAYAWVRLYCNHKGSFLPMESQIYEQFGFRAVITKEQKKAGDALALKLNEEIYGEAYSRHLPSSQAIS